MFVRIKLLYIYLYIVFFLFVFATNLHIFLQPHRRHVFEFLPFGDIRPGAVRLLRLLCAVRALRRQGDVHVPPGAVGVPAGQGARLWLLPHVRPVGGAGVRGLHRDLHPGLALSAAERRGEAPTRPPPRQRRVHQRKRIQTVSSSHR